MDALPLSGGARANQARDTCDGVPAVQANLPAKTMQQVYTIRLRNTLAERACGLRRYEATAKKVQDDPACPYRKKVEVPAEFLEGKP
jgi:hypothetical protein